MRVTENTFKGTACADDFLLGIEHHDDAPGVIENCGDKISLRLQGYVEFSNFVIAARQLRDHLLKQSGLPLHLFLFLVKLDKRDDLRTQNFRYKWFCQVVDSAQRITFENMLLGFIDRGQENDRSVTRLLTFANQSSRFEAVDRRHIHIENDEGEFLMKEKPQGIDPGWSSDKILSEIAQERFQCDQIFDVIINQQDTDLLFGHAFIL